MKNQIVFELNQEEKIVIPVVSPIEMMHCCSEVEIFFDQGNKKYLINQDSLRESLYVLHGLLKSALAGNLQLHESISQDIGYLYNEDLYWSFNEDLNNRPPHLVHEKNENNRGWVGHRYALWCHDFQSWIYNDVAGNIIFELTPIYPGHYGISEPKSNEIEYKNWMQQYQPFLIRTIPQEIAEKWAEQSNKILSIIGNNNDDE